MCYYSIVKKLGEALMKCLPFLLWLEVMEN